MNDRKLNAIIAGGLAVIGLAVGFIFGLTLDDRQVTTDTVAECPADAVVCQEIHTWRRGSDAASSLKPNAQNRESDSLETVRPR